MMTSIVPSVMTIPQPAAGGGNPPPVWKGNHISDSGPAKQPPALFRLELQRRRIDAVAQPGRAGPIGKDVSEMAATFRTQHFGADHAVAVVAFFIDMALGGRGCETWPSATGIKLGVGFE